MTQSIRTQRIIQRKQYPTYYREGDRVDTSQIADDWDKLIGEGPRHSTDEVLGGERSTAGQPGHAHNG